MDCQTKTEMGLGEKYDDLVRFSIKDLVEGIPEVTRVLETGVIGDTIQAESMLVWKKTIMTAMKDLDPAQKFLFLCAAEFYIGVDPTSRREHFRIVPQECYKSNALAYGSLWELKAFNFFFLCPAVFIVMTVV